MLSFSITFLSLWALASAHFSVDYPYWRGDSFGVGKSQWIWPCANVTETTDISNRTQWPASGGSIKLDTHHPWALTYINLGLGTNVSSWNYTLLANFNQTGNGTFCLKKAILANVGLNASTLEGKQGSLQIVQISTAGNALYNCADITFNSSAALLSDNDCANSTGVAGVAIQNVGATPTSSGSASSATASKAAAAVNFQPFVSGGVLAVVVAFAFGMV